MDELKGKLLELIGFIEGIAPNVWQIYIKQAHLMGYQYIAFGSLSLLICIICAILAIKHNDDSDMDVLAVCVVISATTGIFGFWILSLGIPYLINPEYYVIQELISQLSGLAK